MATNFNQFKIEAPKTSVENMAVPPPNSDEYSPSATLIPFDRPLPLLRTPIKSPPPNNHPTLSPYLLAFNSPRSFATSYTSCQTQITQQCEAGARIGCSISASDKCKTPWWKMVLGIAKQDLGERAKCEEEEMEACFVAARAKCGEFAKEKCFPAFRDARVVVDGLICRGEDLIDCQPLPKSLKNLT